jgi:pyruvate, water dikinase
MLIKDIKQLNRDDVDIAGGKGASLGEMINGGISVPPGFVILASTFDQFLAETDIQVEIEAAISEVKHNDINSVEKASVKIRDIIHDSVIPKDIAEEIIKEFEKLGAELVAVRSSATAEDSEAASWAGELDSFLNVTKDNLLESVKKCWSSLFTPRAIFYRYEKNLQDQAISVAVVVQKMAQSEVSGITFTVHPVTEDKNQMIIEAGFGLGEAIVGGMITPDTYVIDKTDFSLIDINISKQEKQIIRTKEGAGEAKVKIDDQEKQKLSNKQIIELTKICLGIEKHYGFPCDIEWALESGKFYIVQSRPITTLSK